LKEKNMVDDILVTMNGVSIITRSDLEKEKERIIEQKPRLKEAFARMDAKILGRELVALLTFQKIIKEYIRLHKLDETDAYAAELKKPDATEDMVNVKFFGEQFVVTIDDAEIKDIYEENKDEHFRIVSSDINNSKEVEYIPYEDLKEKIRKRLEYEERYNLIEQKVDALREEYNVHVNEDLLN
jgi:hypothetical protein